VVFTATISIGSEPTNNVLVTSRKHLFDLTLIFPNESQGDKRFWNIGHKTESQHRLTVDKIWFWSITNRMKNFRVSWKLLFTSKCNPHLGEFQFVGTVASHLLISNEHSRTGLRKVCFQINRICLT